MYGEDITVLLSSTFFENIVIQLRRCKTSLRLIVLLTSVYFLYVFEFYSTKSFRL